MKEYGIGDPSTIKEIISEVDTDNVRLFQLQNNLIISLLFVFFVKPSSPD